MSDNISTALSVNINDADFFVPRKKTRTLKDGTVVETVTEMDALGVMRSGNTEERAGITMKVWLRSIDACNFASALHNMRRVFPVNTLKPKKGTPDFFGLVYEDHYDGYKFVVCTDKSESPIKYNPNANDATSAHLYARAIIHKVESAKKELKGEKADMLQLARAIRDKVDALNKARDARQAAKTAAPALEAA